VAQREEAEDSAALLGFVGHCSVAADAGAIARRSGLLYGVYSARHSGAMKLKKTQPKLRILLIVLNLKWNVVFFKFCFVDAGIAIRVVTRVLSLSLAVAAVVAAVVATVVAITAFEDLHLIGNNFSRIAFIARFILPFSCA